MKVPAPHLGGRCDISFSAHALVGKWMIECLRRRRRIGDGPEGWEDAACNCYIPILAITRHEIEWFMRLSPKRFFRRITTSVTLTAIPTKLATASHKSALMFDGPRHVAGSPLARKGSGTEAPRGSAVSKTRPSRG